MELQSLKALGGVDLLHSQVDKFSYAPHWHDAYVFAIYRSGAKNFKCARTRGVARAGDMLVIAPGTIHSASTFEATGWVYVSLYLTAKQIAEATGLGEHDTASKVPGHAHLRAVPALLHRLEDVLNAGNGLELALSEWLLDTLDSIEASPERATVSPKTLRKVFDRIRDVPAEPVSLSELAGLAGLTPEHLSRAFKAQYGLSPFQLLIAARVSRARDGILSGIPLAEAAAAAGFADQSHMSRWIKRMYGVTPRSLAKYQ